MGRHTRLDCRRARAGCGAVEAPRAFGGRRGGPGHPAARAAATRKGQAARVRTGLSGIVDADAALPGAGHARAARSTDVVLAAGPRAILEAQPGRRPCAPAPAQAVHASYAVHAAHAARPDLVLQSPLCCPFVRELTHRNARRGKQAELQELQRRGVRSDVVRVVGPLSEELRAARCKVRNPRARVLCRGCRVDQPAFRVDFPG